jgi:UDP-N-acetylglucosamine--N-acetylmuramyl-(pentapeptide) pyrophosphoryl-undecaprenol N-acetylglucosamine transferase
LNNAGILIEQKDLTLELLEKTLLKLNKTQIQKMSENDQKRITQMSLPRVAFKTV